ncbi:phage tail protein [Acinetobacter sp. JW]|uniref:phage tail-collar fiber domain-containing protein n=1 Tax=Acinetobacter sp. JW TaxID=2302364 RepID=UPI000E3244A8|nr:phage tail protein [Acinetobacter sp. JW]RFF22787.1 hypothetical protein DZ985_18065 [Acinetobacter sp. JW]
MSYYTKITKAGLAAITAAMNNNSKVPITYMAFGDGNGYTPEPDENAITLQNEVYRVGVNKVEVHNKNPNWLVCEAIIPSAVGGFNIREVALFDNTGNIMLAIASYPPTYKPSVEEGAAKIQTIRIVLQVDNTGNFELLIDPDIVLATLDYVDQSTKDKVHIVNDINALKRFKAKFDGQIVQTQCHTKLGFGAGKYRFQQLSNLIDNGGTIVASLVSAGVWILLDSEVSIQHFGGIGDYILEDGTVNPAPTNNILACQKYIDAFDGNLNYGSGNYYVNGVLGFPTVKITDGKIMNITSNDANVYVEGGEALYTSARSLTDPLDIKDLYTSRIFATNVNYIGVGSDSKVFNGDRLYNVIVTKNSFSKIKKIVHSYRKKLSDSYPNGYLQSFWMLDNQITQCHRIIDAKHGFNIKFNDNTCENNYGGLYIDGPGDPAITQFRCNGNIFEGGGLFLKLGAILGGSIHENYFEANTLEDASTLKCHMDLRKISGGGLHSGLSIDGNTFGATTSQKTDTEWVDVRLDPFYSSTGLVAPPTMNNNWSNSYQMVTHGAIQTAFGNGGTGGVQKNAQMGIPTSPATAGVSFERSTKEYLASSHLSNNEFTICELSVSDIKNFIPFGVSRRSHTAELTVFVQNMSSGSVCLGSSVFKILLVIQAPLGAGNVDEVYIGASLLGFSEVADNSLFDDKYNSSFRKHFTNPSIRLIKNGDIYQIKASGYSSVAVPNYGSSDRVLSSTTLISMASAAGRHHRGFLKLL